MADSQTPRPTASSPPSATSVADPNPCADGLTGLEIPLPLGVAYSGGADSTALLLAASARWPGSVHALHVHHGIQSAADGFVEHCRSFCESLGVALRVIHVDGRHKGGESPEDAARRARYQALAAAATELGLRSVLLAQHADDQAETLLLALSRGAGLPGLAAMPARFERHGVRFERPCLSVRSSDIRNWLLRQKVSWIEDPSNAETALTRNRIRHDVLPALERAFPSFRSTLARSARHAAQAQGLLDELAVQDLQSLADPPAIAPLRRLSSARQGNALRHWLKTRYGVAASSAQLSELLTQVQACSTRGHAIDIKVASGHIHRRGDVLVYLPDPGSGPAPVQA